MASKSAFAKALDRLRDQARKDAERGLVLAAFDAGEQLTRADLDRRMADWTPPDDQALQTRAAQKLVAAVPHLRDRAALLAQDRDGLTAKHDRIRQGLDEARAQAEAAAAQATKELEQAEADLESVPEDLREVAPSGRQVNARAQGAGREKS